MSDPITIYSGSTGLNIVDPPTRLIMQDNGFVDIQVAINVTIDRSGRVQSRPDVRQLQEGNFHSLFCKNKTCLVVSDGILYKVAIDGSLSIIKFGLTDAKMDYTQVGDRIYYTNNYDLGIVYQEQYVDWIKENYYGPETHRHFDGPIPGNHLCEFFGRIIITKDNVLYYSEPYNFGLFNFAGSFIQFHTKIIMLATVNNGLFISTENNTYFLVGRDPKQWQLQKVAGYPAIEWTNTFIEASDIGAELPGQYAVWASKEGAILGTPEGNIINLNKRKIIYPEAAKTGFGGMFGTNFIHGMR